MKKINQKGFAHHLLIFGLLALVVGAAGYAGWRIYSAKKLDAKAAGWTKLMDESTNYEPGKSGLMRVYACRGKFIGQGRYVVKFTSYFNIPMNASADVGIAESPYSFTPAHELPIRGYSYTYYNASGTYSQYAFAIRGIGGKSVKVGELASC